jgi:2'-5' RNA ligase
MYRLFIAIRPPRAARELLCSGMGEVTNARWQTDAQLHLTLRFIGNVDPHQGDDLVAALAQVRAAPFSLTIAGAGSFASRGRIHTLWAGVTPSEPLEALRRRIGRAIDGIIPKARESAFVPHITLARFTRGGGPTPPLPYTPVPPITFDVRDFTLFESTLTEGGATYSVVERYELA